MITGEYPPMIGGISDYTAGLVEALYHAGVDCTVISDAQTENALTTPGWSTFGIPKLRSMILNTKPDVVHIQYETAAFGLGGGICLLPRFLPVPTIVTFHDTNEPYLFPKAGGLRRRANAHLAQQSVAAICTNAGDATTVAAYGNKKVRIIPLGNNLPPVESDRTATRATLGIPEDAPVVGFFGMQGPGKGIETLVEAVQSIEDGWLVLIGAAQGAIDLKIGTEATGAASERLIRTGTGTPEQISAWLSACDILALPYRDGVSFRRTTLIAALAHGLPVITTTPPAGSRQFEASGDLPQLRDGEHLLLVPPDDAPALSIALRALLADRDLRQRIGDAGQRAAAAFDWTVVAKRHSALYHEVARG